MQTSSQCFVKTKEYYECPQTVVKIINSFLKTLNTSIKSGLKLVCIESKDAIEVLACSNDAYNILGLLKCKHHNVFSAGIHIARISKDFKRITPLLGLLNVINTPEKCYIVVNEHAEKLFLYGRDVFEESILECSESLTECKIVVVLNKLREPIGWAKPQKLKHKIVVRNLLDLGWYLRCGV